jgi:hypothetical protein
MALAAGCVLDELHHERALGPVLHARLDHLGLDLHGLARARSARRVTFVSSS